MLGKSNQTYKAVYYDSSYMKLCRIGKCIKTESRLVVTQGWVWKRKRKGEECLLIRTGFLSRVMKAF